jgi:hypothetical protein
MDTEPSPPSLEHAAERPEHPAAAVSISGATIDRNLRLTGGSLSGILSQPLL